MSECEHSHEPILILPAECVGVAKTVDGVMNVGGVEIRWDGADIPVYVRRWSDDLGVAEILIAHHDGLASEELDEQNRQAEEYPLGPKEYWRGEMVGKWTYMGELMTDEMFEADWAEGEDDEDDDE